MIADDRLLGHFGVVDGHRFIDVDESFHHQQGIIEWLAWFSTTSCEGSYHEF